MTVKPQRLDVAIGTRADLAWQRLVALDAAIGTRLYGYAVHLGVDGPRANDLVQDVLIRLWRELARGVEVASPEPWLFRTVDGLRAYVAYGPPEEGKLFVDVFGFITSGDGPPMPELPAT